MAYQAWVTNAQMVLRRRRQEQVQEQTQQLPVGESGRVRMEGGDTGQQGTDQHPYAQEAARAWRRSWQRAQRTR